MKNWRSWLALPALVLLANAWALVSVARNRSGEPGAVIELTDAELRAELAREENSGVALHLEWLGPARWPPYREEWLDAAKLAELGVPTARGQQRPGKPVFVALEYDGPAWKDWMEKHPPEEVKDPPIPRSRSRLVVVDAARDAATLRRRYPDRSRYWITRGLVRAHYEQEKEQRRIRGYVSMLVPDLIHVPLPWSEHLREWERKRPSGSPSPRYRVRLAVGHNLEPWVVDVRPESRP